MIWKWPIGWFWVGGLDWLELLPSPLPLPAVQRSPNAHKFDTKPDTFQNIQKNKTFKKKTFQIMDAPKNAPWVATQSSENFHIVIWVPHCHTSPSLAARECTIMLLNIDGWRQLCNVHPLSRSGPDARVAWNCVTVSAPCNMATQIKCRMRRG